MAGGLLAGVPVYAPFQVASSHVSAWVGEAPSTPAKSASGVSQSYIPSTVSVAVFLATRTIRQPLAAICGSRGGDEQGKGCDTAHTETFRRFSLEN